MSEPSTESQVPTRPEGLVRASAWKVAATALIALIALFFLLVVLLPDRNRGAAPAAPGAPSRTAPDEQQQSRPGGGPPVNDTGESVCGLPDGEQNPPVAAPAGARWETVGTMSAPNAPGRHGPGIVEGGIRSCFAHSPMGALYAALNLVAQTTDPTLHAALVRDRTVPGPERDAALARVAAEPAAAAQPASASSAGFAFLSYDRSTCALELLLRRGESYRAFSLVLRWHEGDWKLVLAPSGGGLADDVHEVTNVARYTLWSPP